MTSTIGSPPFSLLIDWVGESEGGRMAVFSSLYKRAGWCHTRRSPAAKIVDLNASIVMSNLRRCRPAGAFKDEFWTYRMCLTRDASAILPSPRYEKSCSVNWISVESDYRYLHLKR